MSIYYIFFVIKAYIFVLYLVIISRLFTIILETRKKIHLLCIFYHFIICTFCIKKIYFISIEFPALRPFLSFPTKFNLFLLNKNSSAPIILHGGKFICFSLAFLVLV